MGTLTVRENLVFSASLRLPSSISDKEKEERVDDVIQELGLQECANSKVNRVRIIRRDPTGLDCFTILIQCVC